MTFEKAYELAEGRDEYLKDGKNMLAGLTLLSKYCDNPEEIIGAAEHDVVYLKGDVEKMPEHDILQLIRWGFHLSGDGECWALFV